MGKLFKSILGYAFAIVVLGVFVYGLAPAISKLFSGVFFGVLAGIATVFFMLKLSAFSLIRRFKIKIVMMHALTLVAGIGIFGIANQWNYDAGSHLTPKSVHVSGYYRSDGTYVHPYNRRPAGGVAHDAPYEDTQSHCSFFMGLGAVLSLFGIFAVGCDIFIVFCGPKPTTKAQIGAEIKRETMNRL